MIVEQNLMFVAVTRARETVVLYHTALTHPRSRQRFDRVSQLLEQPIQIGNVQFRKSSCGFDAIVNPV